MKGGQEKQNLIIMMIWQMVYIRSISVLDGYRLVTVHLVEERCEDPPCLG